MINYSNNTGETEKDAIIISGAENSFQGIRAEYDYISQKFGKENEAWQSTLQQLLKSPEGKRYDLITFKLASGETKKLFFDISDFFGKE